MTYYNSKNDLNLSLCSFLIKLNELLDKHMPWEKITKMELKKSKTMDYELMKLTKLMKRTLNAKNPA